MMMRIRAPMPMYMWGGLLPVVGGERATRGASWRKAVHRHGTRGWDDRGSRGRTPSRAYGHRMAADATPARFYDELAGD